MRDRAATHSALPSTSGSEPAARASRSSVDAGMAAVRRMLTPEVEAVDASGANSSTAESQTTATQADADKDEPGLNQYAVGYATVKGTPFVSEKPGEPDISPLDITQGALGDCWLLSAMAAIARENPEAIRRLIKDNGDGTYDVTIYLPDRSARSVEEMWAKKKPKVFHVDDKFPTNSQSPDNLAYAQPGNARGGFPKLDHLGAKVELWPMLLEKAAAMAVGDYVGIEGGTSATGLELLLPKTATFEKIDPTDEDGVFAKISAALKAHRAVTAGSVHSASDPITKQRVDELKLVLAHVYSVKSVNPAEKTIQLQNPWGRDDLDLSAAEFVQFFDQYSEDDPS